MRGVPWESSRSTPTSIQSEPGKSEDEDRRGRGNELDTKPNEVAVTSHRYAGKITSHRITVETQVAIGQSGDTRTDFVDSIPSDFWDRAIGVGETLAVEVYVLPCHPQVERKQNEIIADVDVDVELVVINDVVCRQLNTVTDKDIVRLENRIHIREEPLCRDRFSEKPSSMARGGNRQA